jgi:acetyl-CoA carboxylase biotin carboxyl carrier protein
MDIKQIKAIISMMTDNNLSEFSMEQDGLKIRIRRGPDGVQQVVTPATVVAPAPAVPATASSAGAAESAASGSAAGTGPAPAEQAEDSGLEYITSPIVGTFYAAASPDSPSYIEKGQDVDEETVVCIIEAMKVMNEIKAEMKGTIVEVLVENAKPVEFGQKLYAVRPK